MPTHCKQEKVLFLKWQTVNSIPLFFELVLGNSKSAFYQMCCPSNITAFSHPSVGGKIQLSLRSLALNGWRCLYTGDAWQRRHRSPWLGLCYDFPGYIPTKGRGQRFQVHEQPDSQILWACPVPFNDPGLCKAAQPLQSHIPVFYSLTTDLVHLAFPLLYSWTLTVKPSSWRRSWLVH